MTAQKKTIIKRAFLCVMGDLGGEGVDILVVIKDRDSHRVQMRGLPGEGFLHLKAADVELGFFDQTGQHRGVNRVNVKDGVGFRKQTIDKGVQPGLRRRFTTGRGAIGGNLDLQEVIGGEAAFVLSGFAEPAQMFVLTHRHIAACGGGPAFGTNPAAGVDQMRELQVISHFLLPSRSGIFIWFRRLSVLIAKD